MSSTLAFPVPSSSIDRSKPYFVICIDYGSGKLSVQCKFVQAGENADAVEPDTIQLLNSENEQKQDLLVFTNEAGADYVLYGAEVTEHLQHHPKDAPNVIDMLKLALYEPYKDKPVVQRLYAILGVQHGDLWQVTRILRLHLEKIRRHVLRWYRVEKPALFHASFWDSVQLETMITVPVMWNGTSQSIMRNAAVDAGFSNVRLRLEPLAAAALNMLNYVDKGWIKVSSM